MLTVMSAFWHKADIFREFLKGPLLARSGQKLIPDCSEIDHAKKASPGIGRLPPPLLSPPLMAWVDIIHRLNRHALEIGNLTNVIHQIHYQA